MLERDGDGHPTQARAKLHVERGPLTRDFNLLFDVKVDPAETVALTRVPHEGRDDERFDVTWRVSGGGQSTRIELELGANLDVSRFIPLGGVGDSIWRFTHCSRRTGVRAVVFNPVGLGWTKWLRLSPIDRARINAATTVIATRNLDHIDPVTAVSLARRTVLPGTLIVLRSQAHTIVALHEAVEVTHAMEEVLSHPREADCDGVIAPPHALLLADTRCPGKATRRHVSSWRTADTIAPDGTHGAVTSSVSCHACFGCA